ncbi:hypothetical protein Pcinc_006246 [Petrolisthes cinctipes]|uniref:HAT C-terminal dimerisation domain-containing protein n=1 Tax=Petrolisthes cinctipes TaxID=88211 RepID=A0AAE1GBL7_PETCI|nr:hypothetical protein Pcinc_006246 [Petrolisthes cinctipes]
MQSTVSLWIEVGKYTDASGMNPFQELYDLAISVLSLPNSNAEVERLFSQLNLVKTNLRNRLSTSSVSAVLTIRSGLKRVEKCCHSYELPASAVQKISTMAAYTSSVPSSNSSVNTVVVPDLENGENVEEDVLFSIRG